MEPWGKCSLEYFTFFFCYVFNETSALCIFLSSFSECQRLFLMPSLSALISDKARFWEGFAESLWDAITVFTAFSILMCDPKNEVQLNFPLLFY